MNKEIYKSARQTVEKDYKKSRTPIKEQELDEEIKYLWNKILKKCEKYR